ncbi:MAG: urocanate hydratase, partial [Deltaproteobacteria bacterium]
GVGWGEALNGGFGMVLDGSEAADRRLRQMLFWDVNNGIARRAWARNEGALWEMQRAQEREPLLRVTMPELADESLVDEAIRKAREDRG